MKVVHKPTLDDFRKWAAGIGHYAVVEAIERYLKQLKEKEEDK